MNDTPLLPDPSALVHLDEAILDGTPGCDFAPVQHSTPCSAVAVCRFNTRCGGTPHGRNGCADILAQWHRIEVTFAERRRLGLSEWMCNSCDTPAFDDWAVIEL